MNGLHIRALDLTHNVSVLQTTTEPITQVWNLRLIKDKTFVEVFAEYAQRKLQQTPQYSVEIIGQLLQLL